VQGANRREENELFSHTKQFQYNAKPDAPDPIFAKQMQELIGGQWGEMSVMMGYLFQGWNCRGPAKYRDMLMDTATEEIGHVEMLATMVVRLLETSPVEAEEAASNGSDGGIVGSVLGGGDTQQAILNAAMNPQHAIVTGGARGLSLRLPRPEPLGPLALDRGHAARIAGALPKTRSRPARWGFCSWWPADSVIAR
jgi:hypothetical protein